MEALELTSTTNETLVLEATAALSYFKLWQEIPMKWSAKSEPLVPDDWTYINGRESKVSGRNRNASHPINAILNYGYGLLESQVRIACATLGLDTRISYLHAMKHERESLLFDLMEPLRPKLERNLIQLIVTSKFTSEDFTISMQGACNLNSQLARHVIVQAIPGAEVQASIANLGMCYCLPA